MKRNQIEFRRFNHTLGEMEYSPEMAGGLEQFFSNDCCDELSEEYQFMRMLDCDGVKIFEGDILAKFYDGTEEILFTDIATLDRFPTFWLKNESFGFEGRDLDCPSEFKIVGNFHQNKELLEYMR